MNMFGDAVPQYGRVFLRMPSLTRRNTKMPSTFAAARTREGSPPLGTLGGCHFRSAQRRNRNGRRIVSQMEESLDEILVIFSVCLVAASIG